MSRTIQDRKLDTRAARAKLPPQPQPFWRAVDKGLSLGYRKLKVGGTWIMRRYIGNGTYALESIGTADDLGDADGVAILSFFQAQKRARELAGLAAKAGAHGTTIASTLEAYFDARERRGKSVAFDRRLTAARILPALGTIELSKLTAKDIENWLTGLGASPRMIRAPKGGIIERPVTPSDANALRKRRASANRIFTILRAALNHAFRSGKIDTDVAWRRVRPFRDAGAPTIHFLTQDECLRLVATCEPDFAALVSGALATGCRYGELGRLQTEDFHQSAGSISVQFSEKPKPGMSF